ncbi:septum site-determining protein MinC [Hahella aquimaris]|uniref:septum site-determining protein MinC n=1 Tax=Hahella sp. HNIBRBA332 TaxID=3015983 RepID=UPI00273B309E|nr:septum site-determining protein MinC [Hahella sp. HNIBRBA332]WLQ11562.1 septum site-determining protein MinC [Hahella sp. HNIBRBA332]
MPQATADLFSSPCLQFKGSMVPLTTLELLYFEPDKFSEELREKVKQAPNLFHNLPIVVGLEKLAEAHSPLDFSLIQTLCEQEGIRLIGVRTDAPEQTSAAQTAGLAVFQPSRGTRNAEAETPAQESPAPAAAETGRDEAPPQRIANRVITTPVRSGQQVYAPGGDLIVLAPVSAGAEILADGNIHVYAPLRGRALAGVQGDVSARIFCQSLEAELVSVAGQYKISEDLQGEHWKQATQICLDGEKLTIKAM